MSENNFQKVTRHMGSPRNKKERKINKYRDIVGSCIWQIWLEIKEYLIIKYYVITIAMRVTYNNMLLLTGVDIPFTGTSSAPEVRRDPHRLLELQSGEGQGAGNIMAAMKKKTGQEPG